MSKIKDKAVAAANTMVNPFEIAKKPNEFGFFKVNEDRICLLHEDLKCDLIQGKTSTSFYLRSCHDVVA